MFRHKCTQLFLNGKNVKQGARSQKKGKERFLLPKWPEMLNFVFEKSEYELLWKRKRERE